MKPIWFRILVLCILAWKINNALGKVQTETPIQHPTTNHGTPASTHQHQTTNHGTPASTHQHQTTNHGTPASTHQHQTTNHGTSASTQPPPTTTPAPPGHQLDCTFEEGTLCRWYNAPKIHPWQFNFTVNDGQHAGYLPFHDHTRGNIGKFAWLISNDLRPEYPVADQVVAAGQLNAINPFYESTESTKTICFEFYYFLYSYENSTVRVQLSQKNQSPPLVLYESFDETGTVWHRALIEVNQSTLANYQQWEIHGFVRHGSLALDDIKARPCLAKKNITECDFESGTSCMFDPQPWQVYTGAEIGAVDHTTRTPRGHVFGLRNADQTVYSRAVYQGNKCFQFSYRIVGNASLTVALRDIHGKTQAIWVVAGETPGRAWYNYQEMIGMDYDDDTDDLIYTVGLNAKALSGEVYIDDVDIQYDYCQHQEGQCNFESGNACSLEIVHVTDRKLVSYQAHEMAQTKNGSWLSTIYVTDYVDTIWHVYTPFLRKPFIANDNTLNSPYGQYLVLDTLRNDGFRGIFITERITLESTSTNKALCLSLAVVKPTDDTVLEIYQGESGNSSMALKLYDIRQVLPKWKVFEIQASPVNSSSVDMSFFLIATIMNRGSYVGVDDVIVTRKRCQHPDNVHTPTPPSTSTPGNPTTPIHGFHNGRFYCDVGRSLPVNQVCDQRADCADGSDEMECGQCSFVNHWWCGYNATKRFPLRDYQWRFTDQSRVGPNDFHLHDSVTASGTAVTPMLQSATLNSPIIRQTYTGCELRFRYMYHCNDSFNNEMERFLVLLRLENEFPIRVWQNDYHRLISDHWHEVRLRLDRLRHPFQLVFFATPFGKKNEFQERAKDFQSIYGVEILQCEQPQPAHMRCSGFECRNHVCIHPDSVCDFEDDCGDGSDEIGCDPQKMTDFQSGGPASYNLWGETVRKEWTAVDAEETSDNSLRNGPAFDHTNRFAPDGRYLFVRAGKNGVTRAIIDSPPVMMPKPLCAIRMFVMKNSPNATFLLKVWNLSNGNQTLLNEFTSIQSTFERIVMASGQAYPGVPFKFLLEAELRYSPGDFVRPYVAVDDISFSSECQILDHDPAHLTTPSPNCLGVECLDHQRHLICVPPEHLCDFVSQCADGQDERHCGECTFDHATDRLCGWQNFGELTGQTTLWREFLPASDAHYPMPRYDANNRTEGGYGAAMTWCSAEDLKYAYLQSPRINGETKANCKFRFELTSSHGFELIFRVNDNERMSAMDGAKLQWKSFEVNINRQPPGFNMVLDIGPLMDPDDPRNVIFFVAVDNLRLVDCDPHQNHTNEPETIDKLNCDFETDLCGWTGSDWLKTNLPTVEPGMDHTGMILPRPQQFGNWITTQIWLRNSEQRYQTHVLRTLRPVHQATSFCLEFWYYFFGIEQATFSVQIQTGNHVEQLWLRTQPDGRDWRRAAIEIPPQTEDFQLEFLCKASKATVAGLDDIRATAGACPSDPRHEFCDFETNRCDWMPKSGQMDRFQDGRQKDHTTGTVAGHSLTAVNNQPSSVVKQFRNLPYFATTDSPVVNPLARKTVCIRLFYYFSIQNDDSITGDPNKLQLSVMLDELHWTSTLKNISLADVMNYEQENQWTPLSVSFSAVRDGSLILAIRPDQSGRILLDDINLAPHYCDEHRGSCDFETDTCGWYNSHQIQTGNYGQILWVRVRPSYRFASQNGMPVDHTTGTKTGNYLALPLDMQREYIAAVTYLHSPIIVRPKHASVLCFQMYYFARSVNGTPTAMFLNLLDLSNGGATVIRRPLIAYPGRIEWILTRMEIRDVLIPPVYAFVLESHYNKSISSDLGLDDIDIRHEPCPRTSTPLPPPPTPVPDSEKIADCDFEPRHPDDPGEPAKCQWQFSPQHWSVASFRDHRDTGIGPRFDHTVRSANGHYLLYNQTNTEQNSLAKKLTTSPLIMSPSFKFDRHRCLSFWYYADGGQPRETYHLDIHMTFGVDYERHVTIPYRFRPTGSWRHIRLPVPYRQDEERDPDQQPNGEPIKIWLNYSETQSNQQPTPYQMFAIDDIRIRPEKCGHHHDYTYTFTNGLEDLNLEQSQPVLHRAGHVLNPSRDDNLYSGDVPDVDHTTYSAADGYYFMFANQLRERLNTTYVDSLSMVGIPADVSQPSCLRFAYRSNGIVSAKVYATAQEYGPDDGHQDRQLWLHRASKPWWTVVEIDKQIAFHHRLVFEMMKPLGDRTGYFALDDVEVLSRQCQPPLDCDFNQDHYCSYTDYFDNDYGWAWRIYTADVAILNGFPGPVLDHSGVIGNGYLMLSSWRQTAGQQQLQAKMVSGAKVIQPYYAKESSYCLSIWMWTASGSEELIVHMAYYSEGEQKNTTVVMHLRQVTQSIKKWTQSSVTVLIPKADNIQEVQLILEGRVGTSGKTAALAVDDISFSTGRCHNENITCPGTGRVITVHHLCDFRLDCPDGWDELDCGDRCDFENGWCGWQDTGRRDNDHWQRTNVSDMMLWDPQHAPRVDGSGNRGGHYLMMRRYQDGHSGVTGHAEVAPNFSRKDRYMKRSYWRCMVEFDYYLAANRGYFLKVRAGDGLDNLDTFYVAADRNGTSAGGWLHATAHIGIHWSPFVVEFDGFDQSVRSLIAVDNIRFTGCAIPEPITAGHHCPTNQPVLCNNTRICIEPERRCNGINDCGDNEDEIIGCLPDRWRRCSFLNWGQCDLTREDEGGNSGARWTLANGHQFEDRNVAPGFEPLTDNTQRSRMGSYALLLPPMKGFGHPNKASEAAFLTPLLHTGSECIVRFFYFWHTAADEIHPGNELRIEVWVRRLNRTAKPDIQLIRIKPLAKEQQIWTPNQASYRTDDSEPFQFVIKGWVYENQPGRVAIDDLSYAGDCQPVHLDPTPPTPTPTRSPPGTTAKPDNRKNPSGIIRVVIFSVITVMVVMLAIIFIGYQRRYFFKQNDGQNMVLNMRTLEIDLKN